MSDTVDLKEENNYILDEQVGYILRIASQRHASIFQAHAVDGLTPTQFSALIRIDEMGGCTQNQLGRLISVDAATIKGVVDRLETKGFVRLEPDPNDRRRTRIHLTPTAATMIKNLHEIGKKITNETIQPLSLSEQVTLNKLLKKII